ncbi:hypothetical protein BG011_002163 [Mortierella polycephala]|uniref:Uncharacterized protein n=1 Tax=Mortierella polycephala TaxID=41804 RepID=A0A9P6U560_9FUNG|nr:hypothetical protein BG011_002163 [Mortierella polycephala]
MKLLRNFTIVVVLVSSAVATMTPLQFMNDPKIRSEGVEAYTNLQDPLSVMSPLKLPVLGNIVQIVSHVGDADWSRFEAAKHTAIEEHGVHALATAANLTDIDACCAALIVKTIYDTVFNLPAASKETIVARKKEAEEAASPKAEVAVEDPKKQAEDTAEKGSETVQKGFKAPKEASKKVTGQVKQGADAAEENGNEAAEKVGKMAKGTQKETAGAESRSRTSPKKVNDAGEKAAEETKKKAGDLRQKIAEKAEKVADKVEDVKQEL